MGSKEDSLKKYLCVHGHFYQPPRENPWLETIEYQKSAFPYHDWNERITRECYGPNTCGRLLGKEGLILKLMNNYEYMSFNFGPTLLTWLEQNHPRIYQLILRGDKESQARYNGHGNALAQVYNHIIMPLAPPRDKLTQIRWGIADFKNRFNRDPEGMWLAETAVDNESLELMAEEGIKFTILSPSQARFIRPLSTGDVSLKGDLKKPEDYKSAGWQDVSGGQIDPTLPYRVKLGKKGDRYIDIFFYDGPLSRAVAYENMLTSGEALLARINSIFKELRTGNRLVNIATDGESYGHHFKFGEMALSWLFNHIEHGNEIKLTNYGLFRELFPPDHEVILFENSSWSCSHGVGRWQEDCGCSVSGNPQWNQAWRAPLRKGLNRLASELSSVFEKRANVLINDPYKARDEYIEILLNPTMEEKEGFLRRHAKKDLDDREKMEVFQLLESQRMSLFMFTSCGWFFDDISGLEAMQVLMYASRAIELSQPWAEIDLEKGLMDFLNKAQSNDPAYGHGSNIYQSRVKPLRADSYRLAAHYAICSLVNGIRVGEWLLKKVKVQWQRAIKDNGIVVNIGELIISENMSGREYRHNYLAIRREEKLFYCLVGVNFNFNADQLPDQVRMALSEPSEDKRFDILHQIIPDAKTISLEDLTQDARNWIVNGLASDLSGRIKKSMRDEDPSIQEFIKILEKTGEGIPPSLKLILSIFFIDRLLGIISRAQEGKAMDLDEVMVVASLLPPVIKGAPFMDKRSQVDPENAIDDRNLKRKMKGFLISQMGLISGSNNTLYLKNTINLLSFLRDLKMEPDFWECQNMYYELYNKPEFKNSLSPEASLLFTELGQSLGFIIEEQQHD